MPVGEDQSSHVELTREVARRFNSLYGRASNFDQLVAATLTKLPKDDARYFEKQRKAYQQDGSKDALAKAEGLLQRAPALRDFTSDDAELLHGHLKGSGKTILTEPQALHTEVLRLPGTDGIKMSKSYGNAVLMREDPAAVSKKIKGMVTDPARARRTDPGDPEKCPVWQFHKVYSNEATREWVVKGCKSAGIGCLECKEPVIEAIITEQQPWRERAEAYLADPKKVHWIVEMGTERARTVARQTMKDVREAMGLNY